MVSHPASPATPGPPPSSGEHHVPPGENRLPPDPDVALAESPPATPVLVDRVRPAVLAAIALGGGLGSVARYGLLTAMPTGPRSFPWSTFLINVSGSFVLAMLVVMLVEYWPPSRYARPFLGIGFLGGYTTFSTAVVEADELVLHHAVTTAVLYAGGTLLAGLAAVAFGFVLARALIAALTRAR